MNCDFHNAFPLPHPDLDIAITHCLMTFLFLLRCFLSPKLLSICCPCSKHRLKETINGPNGSIIDRYPDNN